ncbi:hypothetical protein EMCRGX_G009446 [Ephydatia muelleri]
MTSELIQKWRIFCRPKQVHPASAQALQCIICKFINTSTDGISIHPERLYLLGRIILMKNTSSSVLSQLKCQLCSNLLTQPLELPCSALVCTKCIVEWVAATGAENCPCCSDDGPLLSSRIRPASNLILLLLADILVHCVSCSRDVKADAYEAHKCTTSLTPIEEREAVVQSQPVQKRVSCISQQEEHQ